MNARETWQQIPNRDCSYKNTIGNSAGYIQRIRHPKLLWKSDERNQFHDQYQATRLRYNEMIDDTTCNHKLGRVVMAQSVRYDAYKIHEN